LADPGNKNGQTDSTMMRGSQRTGKFTELAMKQAWCATSCAASALAGSLAAVMVTVGCSTTSTKRPPSPSVAIVPSAASLYAVTTTPATVAMCRYDSMWQVDNAVTSMSSGLSLAASPR